MKRLQVILEELNEFFDHKKHHPSNIPSLTRGRLAQLFFNRVYGKFQKKYFQGL